ncbi:MAG: hypothetical protein RBS43_01975 [Candidatus Cloacimonas sp.]|jgi:hypothetical protein|nr:hypothetical protein [Candidatus Cloacimonas sp.]
MSKILYVEDELIRNYGTCKKLFFSLLDPQAQEKLNELEQRNSITQNDIQDAYQNVSAVDICATYPAALAKISSNRQDYDLFVIDRDLSAIPYTSEIDKITEVLTTLDFPRPSELLKEYQGREGDLLLLILLKADRECRNKVFLVTTYTPESLSSMKVFQDVLEVTDFPQDRIIEKHSAGEDKIVSVLADLSSFSIQNAYTKECAILRRWFSENMVNVYVEMVKASADHGRKIDFLQKLRPLLETLLVSLARKIHENNARYWDDGAEPNLRVMEFVKSLDYLDLRWEIDYNNVVKQALFSLWKISSDYGNHPNSNPDDVTSYTVKTLLYQINDVILWYDSAIKGGNQRKET